MKNTLAIVVLTWNDFFNTTKCIKSIYPQLDDKTKLILVDNNSEEKIYNKTINWINKNYKNNYLHLKKNSKFLKFKKKIIILRNNKNLGCGFGHNSGYEFAIKNNFEFIARVDNDMIVPKKFFIKILKNNKILSVGGRVLNFVSIADNYLNARQNVIKNIDTLDWKDGFYRKDIGYKVIDE